MPRLIYVTHPAVVIRPDQPIEQWSLTDEGAADMARFAASRVVSDVGAVVSSAEVKAREAAFILADRLGLPVDVEPDLGENDRSATGYLPASEFERTADAFFARPDESVRGWETARDAQTRVRNCLAKLLARHTAGDLALVGHGAVGTLLWLALADRRISREADQPGPGHYWTATLPGLTVETGWRALSDA